MKIQLKAATYLLLFGLCCCGSDPYLYDRYNNAAPNNPNSQMMPNQGVPEVYYRQGQQIPPQQNYHPNQYQQPPYSAPQYQRPYQPPYQQQYQPPHPYAPPASRLYSNPYTITPGYTPYDIDQYYVPPMDYGTPESITNKHY